MLQAGCTGTEVASTLGISADTLYRACEKHNKIGFADYSAQKKAVGCKQLKLARHERALEGDNTMLIWLSKQRLGETDKNNLDIQSEIKIPQLKWADEDE